MRGWEEQASWAPEACGHLCTFLLALHGFEDTEGQGHLETGQGSQLACWLWLCGGAPRLL